MAETIDEEMGESYRYNFKGLGGHRVFSLALLLSKMMAGKSPPFYACPFLSPAERLIMLYCVRMITICFTKEGLTIDREICETGFMGVMMNGGADQIAVLLHGGQRSSAAIVFLQAVSRC